jgi:prepilin signal peptidase PulO-like enzyme (type II secretory pathway)
MGNDGQTPNRQNSRYLERRAIGRRTEVKMADSKRMAGLIGPTLVVLGASEAKNHRVWQGNSAPVVYLNGLLLFVAGLSIVRAHNLWTRSWPVMVTLVGWFAMLLGLFRMFAPEAQQAHQNALATITAASVVGAVGLFLTSKAGSEWDE